MGDLELELVEMELEFGSRVFDVPGPYPSQPWCRGQHNFMGKRNRYCVVCGMDRKHTDEAVARKARKATKVVAARKVSTWRRDQLAERDGEFCRYCGAINAELTVDHVIPRSRGGSNLLSNLVLACSPCNWVKADRTPEEAGMPLRNLAA